MNLNDITKRESEICELILNRKGSISKKIISEYFNITKSTAGTHLNNLYIKLCINSMPELVYILMQNKIIKLIDRITPGGG